MPFPPNPFFALKSMAKYVRCFRDRTFIVKVGGELLADAVVRGTLIEQLAVLSDVGIRLVLVHGGGPALDEFCQRLSIPSEKVAGRRITTPEVLSAAKAVFCGTQVDLLAGMEAAGVPCVGLSGVDGSLFKAEKRPLTEVVPDGESQAVLVDFGLVGDIKQVNTRLVRRLLEGGYVPVIAPLSLGNHGEVYNTNADTLASELAVAINAEKLIFCLGVPGLLKQAKDPSSLVTSATPVQLEALEKSGAIQGGMRPKLKAAMKALDGGVASVHLVSGVAPDALLAEIFTNEGSGTLLTLQPQEVA